MIKPRKPSPELARALAQQPVTPRQLALDTQLEVQRIHMRTQELRLRTQQIINRV